MKKTKWEKLEIIFELLIFGIVIGIAEDLIAITFATNEPVTFRVIGIVVLVAIPFALLGEVVFDQIDFARILREIFERKKRGGNS